MVTIRFGLPAPDDPEQVTLQTRWGADDVVRPDAYREHFPIGVFMDSSATIVVNNINGSGTSLDSANGGNLFHMLNHPESGLRPNGLNYICWTNQQPYNFELVQTNTEDTIQAPAAGAKIWQVVAPFDKLTSAGGDGLNSTRWFGTYPYNPAVHNEANALDLAQDIVAVYEDMPSVLAYNIWDDIGSVGVVTHVQAGLMIRAMQTLDPRPVSGSFVDSAAVAEAGDGLRLVLGPLYPCGRTAGGVDTAEGDLHRPSFHGPDYVDFINEKVDLAPPGGRYWLFAQAHQTAYDGNDASLRYPTPREMRLIFWESIGAGVKGLFWFVYTDQPPVSEGLGNKNSRARLDVAAELAHRFDPGIRARILQTERVTNLFATSGGGLSGIYTSAYSSTLYDAAHDLTYLVLCNHNTAAASVTVTSSTLTGTLRSLEDGSTFTIGDAVTLPALDGTIYLHVPNAISPLTQTMLTASDNVVTGMRWMRDNGLTISGVAGNGCYEYDVTNDTVYLLDGGTSPVDDHDGNYGEAHKLHGLCLKYLRTHDAGLIPDIEAQVQWHIDIEQAAVTQWGGPWSGSAPYWYWTSSTLSFTENAGGIVGSAAQSVTYDTPGMVRRWTSIDQMHMVGHGLYAYRYLLRNEPAITANTTLWANAASLISRMAAFEASNYPTAAKLCYNLNRIVQGLTPETSVSIADAAAGYQGQQFGVWQVNNTEPNVNPSSNITIDRFFAGVVSLNATVSGTINYLRGMAMDMLASDIGQHDVTWDPVYTGPPGAYPTGWVLRAAGGGVMQYESPRTAASNNGYATDLHYIHLVNSGARDGLSGRAPQRLIVLCLLALMDPTYNIPVELAADGTTVLRSVNVVTACNQWAETMAAYLPESTTNCQRFMAPMHLGTTGSHRTDVIDAAFTGYWAMAVELWHLVNAGASYADYYPIGTW